MIIDCRCRPPTPQFLAIFKSKVFQRVIQRVGPFPLPPSYDKEDINIFLKEMDEAGVDKAVLTGRNVPLGNIENEHIADLVDKHPNKFIGIGGLDPTNKSHDALKEADKCIKELKLKGLSMDPGICDPPMRFDDRRLYPIYAKALELGVPMFLLTGPYAGIDLEQTHPKYIEQVGNDFPRLNLVMSHGCYPYIQETIGVCCRRRNIFVSPDLYQFLPGSGPLIEAANHFLKDQYLFASAYPLAPLKETVETFNTLPVKAEVKENLMHKNAERLLGLA